MRVLIGPTGETPTQAGPPDLAELYASPQQPWLRVNMISTLDGAATGESGTSGSINNPADKQVFDTLRGLADAIVVGAGTARAEGYGPVDRPIVVVSRSASVPETLRGAEPGQVLLATRTEGEHLAEARELLGADHVLVGGSHRIDLPRLKAELVERGLRDLLCEGGPHLLHDLLSEGVVDELSATVTPRLVGGDHPRITDGPPVDVPMELRLLLEHEGTLLGRWFVGRGGDQQR